MTDCSSDRLGRGYWGALNASMADDSPCQHEAVFLRFAARCQQPRRLFTPI
jgi:hypothetical protein